jgi:hypothetical protein
MVLNMGIDRPQEGGGQLEKAENRPTLLSYLRPADGRFALKVSLKEGSLVAAEGGHFPFLVISDQDPLFRLIEAKIITDGGSEVRKVFLMLQKDEYVLSRDDLWPITNRDVDEAWRKAFSFHSREGQDPPALILGEQVNRSGRLIPFQPLFYCKAAEVFFHPPCPRCGSPLEICYEDALLSRSGLQPYSTSLRRHLFCYSCTGKGGPDFYVYSIQSSDPVPVKDRMQLIREFGPLAAGDRGTGRFPCVECPHRPDCYGPDQKALLRIVPFSFYPFYLLVLEGMTLHAVDFLALASGASPDELERQLKAGGEFGRARCVESLQRRGLKKMPFLFEQEDAFFLEILYVKLTFLGQVVRSLGADRKTSVRPELRPSLRSIWMKIPEPEGLLPFFWNFRAVPFDLSRDLKEVSSFSFFPNLRDEGFLGLLWFYALLVNRKQDLAAVYGGLERVFGRVSADGSPSPEAAFEPGGEGIFRPENIFWDPDGREAGREWKPLWDRAIVLGGILFGAGRGEGGAFPSEGWWNEWEGLREIVRKSLFQREIAKEQEKEEEGGQEPSPGLESGTSEDKIIHRILAGILKKWEKTQKPLLPEPAETVILNLKELEAIGQEGIREEMSETVILSAGQVGKGRETGRVTEKGVSESGEQTPASKIREGVPHDDVMAETVILKARKEMAGNPAGETGRVLTPSRTKEQPEEDIMAETVILRPVQRQKKSDGNKK